MNQETTLTLLELSRIYNRNRCVFCTWHTRYGMPYTSLHGNVARISIKDLLAFFDTRIRTSNTPKCWIDNKNTLLAYIKAQNNTPTMTTPSIVNNQSPIPVKIHLDPGASMPSKAHAADTGLDIRVLSVTYRIWDIIDRCWRTFDPFQGSRPRNIPWQAVIDTGVHLQPPAGWGFEARPNSRNRDHLFRWAFSPGTIDGNYTGSIKITLEPRFEWVDYDDVPETGEVCGQLKLEKVHQIKLTLVDHLTPTDRADGGFGSTAH